MKKRTIKTLFLLVVFCLPILFMSGCFEDKDSPYIEVSGVITTYNLNAELNLLNAEGRYFEDVNDEDFDRFTVTRSMVSNFSTAQSGNFTMKITYKGCVVLLDYKVNETQSGGADSGSSGSIGGETGNTLTTKAEIHERFSLLYNSSKYIFTISNGLGVGMLGYVDGVQQSGGYTFHKNRESSYFYGGIYEIWRVIEDGVIVEYKKDGDEYFKDLTVEQSLIPESVMRAVFIFNATLPNMPYEIATYEYSKTENVETISINDGTKTYTYIFTDMLLSEVRNISGTDEARFVIEYLDGNISVPAPPQADYEIVE